MTRPSHINRVSDPDTAYRKFGLRELLTFFLEKRKTVIADNDFSFTLEEVKTHLKTVSSYLATEMTDDRLKDFLDILKNTTRRRKNLEIDDGAHKFLNYQRRGSSYSIKDCLTDHIINLLRYFDLTLGLHDPLHGELNKSRNRQSLFDETQDHKISFLGKTESMSNKDKAIFNALRKKFKNWVVYTDIYDKIITITRDNRAHDKNGYVSDGINELRNKLIKLSGNPHVIETKRERPVSYRLTY